MPFARPTRDDLKAQAEADIQSALPPSEALLRYSNLRTLAFVLAGLASGQYGYLDYIARQSVPFTARDEALEGWAALRGVTRKPSTAATGMVTFTGTNGVTVPANSPVLRSDGFAFVTTADATVSGGSVSVPIQAVATGIVGNSDAGTGFALAAGISGVTTAGTAVGPVTGGADVEDDDALRGRMLFAYANPPQGGSASDYKSWALEVAGVTRAWITPNGMGPSTVVIYFMMDVAQAAHNGFPQGTNGVAAAETRDTVATGDQLTLANYVFARQPVTPLVYAVAPSPNVVNLTIAGLSGASSTLKAAIATAAQQALFLGGVPGGVTNISAIEAAIAAVNGSAGFVLTNVIALAGSVTPGSAGNILSNPGCLPTLGSIIWTA